MADSRVVQLVIFPHRPIHSDAELEAELKGPLALLLSSNGLLEAYCGRKFEEKYTLVYLLVWETLSASHQFLTSGTYDRFNQMVQPILRGRQITWNQHAVLGGLGDRGTGELQSILSSPAIEVAWTPVKEGKVQGYYAQFAKVVNPILTDEPVCDGFFISPHLENPHDQILLINWKSVDAHHVEFENKETFKQCIDALYDYYARFVVPWHIVGLTRLLA